VTIAAALRRQHTAVVGAVEQGKTSFLVASAREDLRREDCAVIVLDPKGDAAAAVLSIVPQSRTTTLLDMAAPRAGFNPLAVDAAPDAIADHVVAALRGLFSEGEVRGSSDRYLRNAIIAVLACGPAATLLLQLRDATGGRSASADCLAEVCAGIPARAG
jgi:type IV secretory pathway VirB4 component